MSEVLDAFLGDDDAARDMTNRQLCKKLFKLLDTHELGCRESFVIFEVVERLLPVELVEIENLGEN